MKQRIAFSVFFLFLVCHEGFSQKKDSSYFYPFVSVGYPYTGTGDLNEYYSSIVDNYRSQGVPIETQVGFGRTLVIGGGVLYNWYRSIRLGVSLGYWYSPAYSSYEDYGGTLKVNGSINDLDVCLMMQSTVEEVGGFPVEVGIRVGATHSSVVITQDARFHDFPEENSHSEFSKTCWGPCFEPTVGSRVGFGKLIVSLEGGYRLASSKLPKNPSQTPGGLGSVSQEFNVSESGFVVLLSLATTL